MGRYSQNNLSVKCISAYFLMLCPKGGHLLKFGGSTTTERVSGWVLSKNDLSVKCISGSFLMLCPKGGHFVEIWWLDYYRAGKWAGTLKTTYL